ncbi:hypothetical protein DP939_23130 [Spongiactinospora rosea]|uniref:Uncharacterized protein n=1 Tax=Spongiactinospora rosea TaxID=2248750 RepID=A0A366LV12_9ACTN|nr:hypothetical protein [Spongiactinospora rosea]RBQ17761.1 hypothetical protein DP939_23130 [Spongiactinospora rosea]
MSPKYVTIAVAAVAVATMLNVAPALADGPSPSGASDQDPEFRRIAPGETLSAQEMQRDLAILNQPAPAPQPITVDELPLNAKDKKAVENGLGAEVGFAADTTAAAAADVWCGNWLSNPGSVSYSSGPGPVSDTNYTSDYGLGTPSEVWWRVNEGKAAANSVWYGWSKMYPTHDASYTDGTPKKITTGWWDTSLSPHFCGWSSSRSRDFRWWVDGSYTAGIRKAEATYVRGHGWRDSEFGWEYGSRVAW